MPCCPFENHTARMQVSMLQLIRGTEWTVEHGSDSVPCANFAAALSHANGLVLRGYGVKVIAPKQKKISIIAVFHRTANLDDGLEQYS